MDYNKLLADYKRRLTKANAHLKFSLAKVGRLGTDINTLSESELGDWESFAARFARASDIFLTKYLKALVLKGDPAFRGSLRDFVNQGEKLGIIDNAELWMHIRELRNLAAHEYEEEKLMQLFADLRDSVAEIIRVCDAL